jgi:transposase
MVMKYLFLKGNSAKKILNNMSVTLGDKHPSYSTLKNWVARFRTGHLSIEDKERCGGPTQVTSNSRQCCSSQGGHCAPQIGRP